MARIDPTDLEDDDDGTADFHASHPDRDQDGVDSLRDTEAEAGEESGLSDTFDMDDREARELEVSLDDRDEPEPDFS